MTSKPRPGSIYGDLVKRAAERARPVPDEATHLEKRELGWRRFNVMLPPETHRAFKLQCIKDEVEMADVTKALIEAWLVARADAEAEAAGAERLFRHTAKE